MRDLARIGDDPEAFEAFYRAHTDAVGRFVARRVDDPHTAADLTAEVFVAVIESAHTFRPDRGTEVAWLYGVARNVIAGEFRRSGRERRTTRRIEGRRLLEPDDIARLESRIDAEQAARAVHRELQELPEGTRAVLELIMVDGLTVTEAAAALGIKAVTARVRMARARKRLAPVRPLHLTRE